jgi:hypothetical protein
MMPMRIQVRLPSFSNCFTALAKITRANPSRPRCEYAKLANSHDVLSVAWPWCVDSSAAVAGRDVSTSSRVCNFPSRVRYSDSVPTNAPAGQFSTWAASDTEKQLICKCLHRWLRERASHGTSGLSTPADANRCWQPGFQHTTNERANGATTRFF